MSEEEKKEEKKEEVKEEEDTKSLPQDQLPAMINAHPNGPSPARIDGWKSEHGEVFASGFSEEELFVWRALTRGEWLKLQDFAGKPENEVDQYRFEEAVCEVAVLWASMENPWQVKAGNAATVYEQILQRSNFYSPQAASLLVVKL